METVHGANTTDTPVTCPERCSTWLRCIVFGLLIVLLAAGCGGDKAKTSSGGGGATTGDPVPPATPPSAGDDPATDAPAPPAAPSPMPSSNVVGPNLNGNWAGYYKSIEGNYQNLTATISHVGRKITITTSMPPGIVKELVGNIDAAGNMLLYDQFDHEDWTTLYGPASSKSINLADYVFINQSLSDTNILILKR